MSDLIGRLRKIESAVTGDRVMASTTNWARNPDGEEAAAEIERLHRELAEARELLGAIARNRPSVECQDFPHQKRDLNHGWNDCGPLNRWNEAWEKVDAFLERKP